MNMVTTPIRKSLSWTAFHRYAMSKAIKDGCVGSSRAIGWASDHSTVKWFQLQYRYQRRIWNKLDTEWRNDLHNVWNSTFVMSKSSWEKITVNDFRDLLCFESNNRINGITNFDPAKTIDILTSSFGLRFISGSISDFRGKTVRTRESSGLWNLGIWSRFKSIQGDLNWAVKKAANHYVRYFLNIEIAILRLRAFATYPIVMCSDVCGHPITRWKTCYASCKSKTYYPQNGETTRNCIHCSVSRCMQMMSCIDEEVSTF